MLRPSYTELMDKINEEKTIDSKVTSRYTIVVASAKRARQLIDGEKPLSTAETDKAVSIAVNEMIEGKIVIKTFNDVSIKERENYVLESGDGYIAYQFDDTHYNEQPGTAKKYTNKYAGDDDIDDIDELDEGTDDDMDEDTYDE